jgi:hypothetical protein
VREQTIMLSSVRVRFFGKLLILSALAGCGNSTKPPVLPELPDSSAPSKAMELYDANHDGFLDDKELEKVPGLKAAKDEVDTNHDGKISEEEIAARIQQWAGSGMGRFTVTCRVTRNGQPLPGAKVVFVPEKFLGGAISSGSGTATSTGTALISAVYAPDPTVKGLSSGFYRVEITKDRETIPAKYNTETTLGAEISGVSQRRKNGSGLMFELEY